MGLSHLDEQGRARMVDVSGKPVTRREATAEGRVRMSAAAFEQVRTNTARKGDVLAVARLAGIGGGKRTAELIPLCHPIGLDDLAVQAVIDSELPGVRITATALVQGRTGVEMEALTAVSVACLAVYDMVKAVDREMRIEGIRLLRKSGGRRGDWTAPDAPPGETRSEED